MSREDQLIPRLRRFFQENPGEILTFDDIAAKFGVSRTQARNACANLREQGWIVTEVVAMVNPERAAPASTTIPAPARPVEPVAAVPPIQPPAPAPDAAAAPAQAQLSERERQLLQLLATGANSNKAIGERMGLSWHTVNDHMREVFQKIGVHSRVDAAVWAVRTGVA